MGWLCCLFLWYCPNLYQTARLSQHESAETERWPQKERNERNGPPRTDRQTDSQSVSQSVKTVELVGAQADWSVGHQSGRPRVRRTRVLSLDRDQIPCRFSHWALLALPPSRGAPPSQSLVASCQGSGPLVPNPHPIPLRPPSTGALPGILAILARRQHRHPLKDNPPISHSHSRARPLPSSSSGLRTRFISDSIPPAPSTSSTACPISSTVLPSLVPTVNQPLPFLTPHPLTHRPLTDPTQKPTISRPIAGALTHTLRRRISSPTRPV